MSLPSTEEHPACGTVYAGHLALKRDQKTPISKQQLKGQRTVAQHELCLEELERRLGVRPCPSSL